MANHGSTMFGSGDHASFVQWLVTLINHGILNDHGSKMLLLTRVIMTNHDSTCLAVVTKLYTAVSDPD